MVSESSCHCHKFNELSNEGTFDDEMVRGDVNDVVEDVVVETAVIVVMVEVVDVVVDPVKGVVVVVEAIVISLKLSCHCHKDGNPN